LYLSKCTKEGQKQRKIFREEKGWKAPRKEVEGGEENSELGFSSGFRKNVMVGRGKKKRLLSRRVER